jgi:predicted metalloendopeptidase
MNYIHREFIHILNNTEWMDNNTREKAIEKAYAIKTNIGHPPQLLNDSEIATIYENVSEH